MSYIVKVQFSKDQSIEVTGSSVQIITNLLNDVTKKFFSHIPASKIDM